MSARGVASVLATTLIALAGAGLVALAGSPAWVAVIVGIWLYAEFIDR